MLVARGEPPEAVFAAATRETLRQSGSGTAKTIRYEPGGTATLVANEGTTGTHRGRGTLGRLSAGRADSDRLAYRPGRPDRGYRDIPGGEPYIREGPRVRRRNTDTRKRRADVPALSSGLSSCCLPATALSSARSARLT
jgi:hypothetical protein